MNMSCSHYSDFCCTFHFFSHFRIFFLYSFCLLHKQTAMNILAKSLVQSNKTKEQMQTAKARNTGIGYQMKGAAAQVKMSEHMKKTAQVMGMANKAMNVKEMQHTAQVYQKEMAKSQFNQVDRKTYP